MTTFDDRENAFENKFAHDEALKFKVIARRNKLLGLWAATKLNKTGADADAYAKEVVLADFQEAGDEDVIRKVLSDIKAHVTEAEIRAQLSVLFVQAQKEIMTGE